MMSHLDLFSGIGGFSLGLRRTGHYKTIGYCDNDAYCQKVLRARMEDGNLDSAPIYDDIYKIPKRLERPFLITAGFPCQPYSVAGKRKGADDSRNLWPILYDTICRLRPKYVLLENVAGLVTFKYFSTILGQLSSAGYDIEWQSIPASSIGARHKRLRLWIVAYTECDSERASHGQSERECVRGWSESCKCEGHKVGGDFRDCGQDVSDTKSARTIKDNTRVREGFKRTDRRKGTNKENVSNTNGRNIQKLRLGSRVLEEKNWRSATKRLANATDKRGDGWSVECRLGRTPNGLPCGMDDCGGWECGVPRVAQKQKERVNRLKTLGNSIVPQLAELIGTMIYEHQKMISEVKKK